MRTITAITGLLYLCTAGLTSNGQALDSLGFSIDTTTLASTRFNPLLTTALVNAGIYEITLFNSLQTQQLKQYNQNDTTTSRVTSLSHVVLLNHGLSMHPTVNIGVDVYVTQQRVDRDVASSPLRVVGRRTSTGATERAVTYVGPRIRIIPFKRLPELSYQSSLLFPTLRNVNRQAQFGADRIQWQHQIFFYQVLAYRLTGQVQLSYTVRFKNERRRQTSHLPTYGAYLVYELLPRSVYVLSQVQYSELRESSYFTAFDRINYDLSVGGGAYWKAAKTTSLLLAFDMPVKYQIGSLTREVKPYSWWRATIGINYLLPAR